MSSSSNHQSGRDSPPPRQPSPVPSFAPLSAMPRRRLSSSGNSSRPSLKDILPPSTQRPERLRLARSCDALVSEREKRHKRLMNKLDGLSNASNSPPTTPRSLPATLSPPTSPTASLESPVRGHRKSLSSVIPRMPLSPSFYQSQDIPPVPPLPPVYSRTRSAPASAFSPSAPPAYLSEVEPMTPLPPPYTTSTTDKSMRTKFKSKILRRVSSKSTLSSTQTSMEQKTSDVGCGGMTCSKFFSLSRPTVTVSSH